MGDAQQLRDDRDRQGLGDVADEVEFAALDRRVEQALDDGLDPRSEILDGARRERLRDEATEAGVIGRLAVEHPVPDQRPERVVPGGIVGAAHLRVRGHVQVRAAEPSIAQQRVDVAEARDQRTGRCPGSRAPGDRRAGVRRPGTGPR